MKKMIFTSIIAGSVLLSGIFDHTSTAQTQTQQTPPPNCTEKEHFNDWDFWLGEWDVYAYPDGTQLQGTNTIEKISTGCAILETWVTQGGTGSSINFYNGVTGKWRQVWVGGGPGYMIDYEGGLDETDGSMFLEGKIQGYSTGTTSPFRGRWTPLENGDVRQYFELFNSETEKWAVWFDGRYVRKKD